MKFFTNVNENSLNPKEFYGFKESINKLAIERLANFNSLILGVIRETNGQFEKLPKIKRRSHSYAIRFRENLAYVLLEEFPNEYRERPYGVFSLCFKTEGLEIKFYKTNGGQLNKRLSKTALKERMQEPTLFNDNPYYLYIGYEVIAGRLGLTLFFYLDGRCVYQRTLSNVIKTEEVGVITAIPMPTPTPTQEDVCPKIKNKEAIARKKRN